MGGHLVPTQFCPDTETEISKNQNNPNTEVSKKLKCHQNLDVTQTEKTQKLKCNQN